MRFTLAEQYPIEKSTELNPISATLQETKSALTGLF